MGHMHCSGARFFNQMRSVKLIVKIRGLLICSEGATIFHPVRTGSPGVD